MRHRREKKDEMCKRQKGKISVDDNKIFSGFSQALLERNVKEKKKCERQRKGKKNSNRTLEELRID
jgi:hypothetical protein